MMWPYDVALYTQATNVPRPEPLRGIAILTVSVPIL